MEQTDKEQAKIPPKLIEIPAGTPWPIVLAFGVSLSFASLVTSVGIGIAGVLLVICGIAGWFRQVLPHEHHEQVLVISASTVVTSRRARVAHIEVGEKHRARLPIESYPVVAGLKGGVVGGLVMIVPALLYGLLTQGSVWYTVNLLGGAGVAHWTNPSTADIAAFHWNGLIMAMVIHTVTSLLIGLLYGAMLPMWPKRPILLGGLLAPLAWTGLLYSILGFADPTFSARISWGWFAVSEVLFGITAGIIVTRTGRIRTHQSVPFMLRMGIEAKEFMGPQGENRK